MIDLRFPRAAACLVLLGALACSSDAGPTAAVQPDALQSGANTDPIFLSQAPDAPTLATLSVSFYAVNGEDREAFIWYHASAGEADSSKLVRFRVTRRSLCTRPSGQPIASGDSILITLTVTDVDRQIVKFQPAGLTFCSGRPAKLTMWYEQADHDFDDDGDIDNADAAYERKLNIWRQETAGSPWEKVTTVLSAQADQAEASIGGFTSYVVAY